MKIADTDFTKTQNTYLVYKRMFDAENGTDYAKQHYEKYVKNMDESNNVEIKRIEYNDNAQRNVIGNYHDNEIVIEKCFNHLNALKRSLSLSQQTNDENSKLFHENIFYRELLNLELSMRTMKTNIKRK